MTDRALLDVHCTPPLEQLASLSHGIIRRYYSTPHTTEKPSLSQRHVCSQTASTFQVPPLGHLLVVMTKLHLIKCLSHGYAETGVSLSPVPAASIRWSPSFPCFVRLAYSLQPTSCILSVWPRPCLPLRPASYPPSLPPTYR